MGFRSKALALLLVVLTLVGTNNVWHAPDDDHDGALIAHDHSAHHARFRGPAAAAAPAQHCAFCHWLTALRIASPARVTVALALTCVEPLPPDAAPCARTVDLLLVAPRPPPA